MPYENSELCKHLHAAAKQEGFEVTEIRETNSDLESRNLASEHALIEEMKAKGKRDPETAAFVLNMLG